MSSNARRIRKRTELTLARDTIAELHARVLRSRAAGEWSTLSRETDRAVREAMGNLVSARREVLPLLQPIRGQLQDLRQQPFAGRDIGLQDLAALDSAVSAIAARVERLPAAPASAPSLLIDHK